MYTEKDHYDEQLLHHLREALSVAKSHRTLERKPIDRWYSILITDLQKIIAYVEEYMSDSSTFEERALFAAGYQLGKGGVVDNLDLIQEKVRIFLGEMIDED